MALQRSIITFTGKLGEMVGYERKGKYYLRAASGKIRQTAATRRASRRFGACSRKAKLIRYAFYPALDIRPDSSHVNRLNKLLIEAAGDYTAIEGFRFNQDAGINRFFTAAPVLSNKGILHIPAQDIIAHSGLTALEVKVIAAHIDLNRQCVTGSDTVVIIMDPGRPFPGTSIPFNVAGEGTLILTVQVRQIHKDGATANRRYQAADIIGMVPLQMPRPYIIHAHPQKILVQIHSALTETHTGSSLAVVQRE